MKKLLQLLLLLLGLAPVAAWAQGVGLGIGTPNGSAMLDVTSTSKGVLIPRMSTSQRGKIASPANGLLVYDTDTKGFWYYNGAAWQAMGAAAGGASKTRTVFVPASAMSYQGTNGIKLDRWGLTMTSDASAAPGAIVPRPADWDDSQPFTVTLYFSAPTVTVSDKVVSWRMSVGGTQPNGTGNGWDSYDFTVSEDGLGVTYPSSNYSSLGKSETWTPKYSSQYQTWYFGSGTPTVANSFDNGNNAMWHFQFQRGYKISTSPETYTGDLTINGLMITYPTK